MQQVTDVVHHWDAMAALVRERVVWVMNNVPPSVRGWNVLAAFILKRRMYRRSVFQVQCDFSHLDVAMLNTFNMVVCLCLCSFSARFS